MNVYLYYLQHPISEACFRTLKKQASKKRLQYAMRYRKREDQVRCLFAEHALKAALQHQGRAGAYHHIQLTAYGKPVFDDKSYGHFNLSHSGDWVACILDKKPIGIDVERCLDRIDLDVIDLFTATEQNYINQSNPKDRLRRFYHLWTLKESYLKAIGTGLHQSLKSFSIDIVNNQQAQLVIDNKVQDQWYFYYCHLDNKHVFAICAQQPIYPNDFKVILNSG